MYDRPGEMQIIKESNEEEGKEKAPEYELRECEGHIMIKFCLPGVDSAGSIEADIVEHTEGPSQLALEVPKLYRIQVPLPCEVRPLPLPLH